MSKNIDVPSDSIISPKLAKKTAGSYQPQSVTPDALLDALSQLLVLLTIHVDVIDGLKETGGPAKVIRNLRANGCAKEFQGAELLWRANQTVQ